LSISEKLTGTLSGFIVHVKPAPFGLLCAWREVPILRQHLLPISPYIDVAFSFVLIYQCS
jgi:hypothetical protein